jgi:ferredoxin--NADP+ reductase
MLLPETQPSADIIMIATGTGIVPFRAFWRRLFFESNTPAAKAFKGTALCIFGVPNSASVLYKDELDILQTEHDDRFKLELALSREHTNAQGGRMYVQDVLADKVQDVYDRLVAGAHIYYCGNKGMMAGCMSVLEQECRSRGSDWKETLRGWKNKGQWHVEVY